jgi:hypothetical protein
MVVGEAVHACMWRCSSERLLELMVEVDCGGQSQ